MNLDFNKILSKVETLYDECLQSYPNSSISKKVTLSRFKKILENYEKEIQIKLASPIDLIPEIEGKISTYRNQFREGSKLINKLRNDELTNDNENEWTYKYNAEKDEHEPIDLLDLEFKKLKSQQLNNEIHTKFYRLLKAEFLGNLDIEESKKLTHRQIALKHRYLVKDDPIKSITTLNRDDIAKENGWTAPNSGQKIYAVFNNLDSTNQRIGVKNHNKAIKDLEIVIKLLSSQPKAKKMAEDELKTLRLRIK